MIYQILLIEDNEDICEVTAFLLGKLGYNVKTASNGLEGLLLFKKHNYDLIITDIFMPIMDGNEFISQLAQFFDLPAIVALSYNTFDIKPNPVVTAIATKPMTIYKLDGIVSQALSQKGIYPQKGTKGF